MTVTPAVDRDGKAAAAKPRFIRKRLASLLASDEFFDSPEIVFYCPVCAEREFGDDS